MFHAALAGTAAGEAGRQLMCCPITAVPHTDIAAHPTLVDAGRRQTVNIHTPAAGRAAVYNTLGVSLTAMRLHAGNNYMPLLLPRGIYLLRVDTDDGQAKVFNLIAR